MWFSIQQVNTNVRHRGWLVVIEVGYICLGLKLYLKEFSIEM